MDDGRWCYHLSSVACRLSAELYELQRAQPLQRGIGLTLVSVSSETSVAKDEGSMDRFVETNRIRQHFLAHPGDCPAIVLLPGLTANAHAFDGLIQQGLSPRFRVLALDLRGRGESDKPAAGYTMADHAADVIGLLDALG